MTKNLATLIGLSAILLWFFMAGLIKKVSIAKNTKFATILKRAPRY